MLETIEQERPTDVDASQETREGFSRVSYDDGYAEFSYRPVPTIATVGLVLSLLSATAIVVWMAMPLCLIALVASAVGLYVIKTSGNAYSGTGVATAGILLSLLFLGGGIAFQVYTYRTEVPQGYERISFLHDLSEKGFVFEDGVMRPHPDIAALDGKKVFLKGYIYQTQKMEDLGSFLFVKDNGDCCFGAQPAIEDRLGVVMEEGKEIDYHAGKVAVAGTFKLNKKYDPQSNLEPIFMIDGELFSTRVSDF
ncbi:MAG: hypothetical protein KDA80_23315 [Planctomycetaceae bacterium]|nr:hypothetical protein [Planctomycetaceae bacterium]